ncbi:zinc finger protein 771-like [Salvelinus namaycush]|uniref:Zinc finger protein 771-like n=1 Tax=Salvelinus namaycush TaxID=8040 RepID=A0A8U0QCP8_SALNM|nr:zinc finger protein 771-like [Salvelinus namaycush]
MLAWSLVTVMLLIHRLTVPPTTMCQRYLSTPEGLRQIPGISDALEELQVKEEEVGGGLINSDGEEVGLDPTHHGENNQEESPSTSGEPEQHQESHTAKSSHCCSVCGRDCQKLSSLERHMRTHTGDKPYSCSVCGKQFREKIHLRNHQKVHTGEKPYACPDCDKSFAFTSALKRHHKLHTGEKIHSCYVWGKSFTQSSTLKDHFRTHSGDKPCSVCGKCFSYPRPFQLQCLAHTGERPYSCAECGQRYIRPQNLRRHQKTHADRAPVEFEDLSQIAEMNATIEGMKEEENDEDEEDIGGLMNAEGEEAGLDPHHGENPYQSSDQEESPFTSGEPAHHQENQTVKSSHCCSVCRRDCLKL